MEKVLNHVGLEGNGIRCSCKPPDVVLATSLYSLVEKKERDNESNMQSSGRLTKRILRNTAADLKDISSIVRS
jgi:hypothetical protein